MAADYKKQAPAYHGITNAKYALRDDSGAPGTEVKEIPYIKSISHEPQVEAQEVFANDSKVLTIPSDQGSTGSLGTTAPYRALEIDLGQLMEVDGATAEVKITGYKRVDLYYEYSETTQSGINYKVKVWALNVEMGKATRSHATDENTATLGEYQYPITIYGDKVKDSTGSAVYQDANGNEITATMVISVPGDANYADFGKTVPVVKVKAALES
ncbi:major tail protein [Merdimmobilis hominis]|uniref:hypothetical protein n=1 Tax=Merdimmobilis hominis TaxID=2897707 RepID=UPI0008F85CF6|nr:hypothetical protein [Merdimmobilis hominis]